MKSLFTFTAEPSPCGYLPDREWSLTYEIVAELSAEEYLQRLHGGWRRFGHALFKPTCPHCEKCLSLRIPVATFQPNRSQRRAMAANAGDVQLRIGAPQVSEAKLHLYDQFHQFQTAHRGWPEHHPLPPNEYAESFVENPFETMEWCYYHGERLIGVGYVDMLPDGLSAIYFYYDPGERERSLGTYNVLSIIHWAREHHLANVYLGYYIEGGRSVEYKSQFRPNEVLQPNGTWRPFRH